MRIKEAYSAYSIDRARKAIAYVKKHHKEVLSPDLVAAEVQMDPKKLQELFRLLTGLTIHNYQLSIRVEYAKAELADFSKTVKAVAADYRFASPHHFIREFKKRNGVTPGRYRNELAAGNTHPPR
jgi:AraC-like DNA-binding protein